MQKLICKLPKRFANCEFRTTNSNPDVSCLYHNKWWVGIVTNVDKEEYVHVKFMHPSCRSRSFRWPHVDICWVPNEHILCKIDIPITSSGRFYSILEHDRKVTEEQFLYVKQ